MTRGKLEKLKRELAQMRRPPQNAAALESFAKRLGRSKVKRGKEPTWESTLPGRFPMSIPHHGGRDLPTGTKHSILDDFEEDISAWDEQLPPEEDDDEGA